MRRLLISAMSLGLLMGALALPAAANSPWQAIEIEPGDSTVCEFEPGISTEYEVDRSTLPQFDQYLGIQNELPNGMTQTTIVFRRAGIQMLKLDSEQFGPDVLIEWQRINLVLRFDADGALVAARGTATITEETPEGQLVDRNRQIFRGVDAEGVALIIHSSGVCNN